MTAASKKASQQDRNKLRRDRIVAVVEFYKKHTLMASPCYDSDNDCWFSEITITWRERHELRLHKFNPPSTLCRTVDDAMSHGLLIARLWVDKKL